MEKIQGLHSWLPKLRELVKLLYFYIWMTWWMITLNNKNMCIYKICMCELLEYQIWSSYAYSSEVFIGWMMSVSHNELECKVQHMCWFGVLSKLLHTDWSLQRATTHKLWNIINFQPNTESNKVFIYLFLKHQRTSMPFILFCFLSFFGGEGALDEDIKQLHIDLSSWETVPWAMGSRWQLRVKGYEGESSQHFPYMAYTCIYK